LNDALSTIEVIIRISSRCGAGCARPVEDLGVAAVGYANGWWF
jgi:hypothetical protein